MLDHMSSTGVMHGDGRRRGEEKGKHEKRDVTAVHARYRNTAVVPPVVPRKGRTTASGVVIGIQGKSGNRPEDQRVHK